MVSHKELISEETVFLGGQLYIWSVEAPSYTCPSWKLLFVVNLATNYS